MKTRPHSPFAPLAAALMVAATLLLLPAGIRPAMGQAADVYIASTPQGAEIAINGKTAGVTPLTLPAVPAGRHLVTASLRGFRTLHQTLDLKPGERNVLNLSLEPLTGLLLVHSTPDRAEVEINGVHRGTTPVLVADLPYGIHRAKITKSGYLPRPLDITIDSRIPRRISTTLTADTATLSVKTAPPGAEVALDGIRQGATPCEIASVRTGEVKLGITAPGHHPFEETLALQAGEVRQIDITLRPQPSSLRITTTPAGARILLNDQFRGRSPVDIASLAAGTYTLHAELPAHDPAARTVQIGLGRAHVEDLTLTPNAGRLEITTEPAGVKVLLNGLPAGETEAAADGTDKLSALFTLPLVPVGTHELTLTKPGYYPLTAEITIARNETLSAHHTLTRRFIPNCQVQTKTEVYRGVLIERNPETIKLELRPGIFKTLRLDDVTSITPLLNAPPVSDTP